MIELLRSRRSIRKFENKKIADHHLELLKEALLRAPTSRNNQAWEFVFVDDQNLLLKLSQSRPHGSSFLKKTPLGIVICGDRNLTDVWIENCSIAATFVQLTALSLDIGSCWIQTRLRDYSDKLTTQDYIRQLLNIPEHLQVAMMIGLGYPAEKKDPVAKTDLKFNKIKYNIYGEA